MYNFCTRCALDAYFQFLIPFLTQSVEEARSPPNMCCIPVNKRGVRHITNVDHESCSTYAILH